MTDPDLGPPLPDSSIPGSAGKPVVALGRKAAVVRPVKVVAEAEMRPEAAVDRPRLKPDRRRTPQRRQVVSVGDLLGQASAPAHPSRSVGLDVVSVMVTQR